MSFKGLAVTCGLLLGFGLAAGPVQAQDTPAVTDTDTAQGPGFWGKFGLYLETMVGESSADRFNTTVLTNDILRSRNFVDLDEAEHARLVVGWTLPEQRGGFRIALTAHRETEFTFNASGERLIASDPTAANQPSTINTSGFIPWWNIQISGGQFRSVANIPTWVLAQDDDNGDGIANPAEVRSVPASYGTSRGVTRTLDNQIQTLDLVYERDFGGRRYSTRWGAGVRAFSYEGNLPVAAWLRPSFQTTGAPTHGGYQGYTDGVAINLLSFTQKSEGYGPVGGADIQFNFLRKRIVLYLLARAAFIVQELETDSGPFFSLVENSTNSTVFPIRTRVSATRDKDVWQNTGEAGVRVRLANGLVLRLAYFKTGYTDALLIPTNLAIPQSLSQIAQGTAALFATRDLRVEGWRGGFSFQF